jgi:glycosyl transferase family 87
MGTSKYWHDDAISTRPIRLWDPLGWLGPARDGVWILLAVNLLIIQWPALAERMQPPREMLPDFFQDYASCRNIFQGLPVYSEHELTTRLYLKSPPRMDNLFIHINAHPPTSVLLAMPFVWLDFETAFVAMNLLSLAALAYSLRIVIRELGFEFGPSCYAPTTALAVTCYPVLEHLYYGQLGLFLSVILLGAWACERNGRPRAAGMLIGLATAIKIFPVFLLAFFAWRRRRDVVVAGLASVALATVVTACILGKQAYIDYFLVVLPRVSWFRVGWGNASILGFFSRLFDPLLDHPDNMWWKTRALVQSKDMLALGYADTVIALVVSFAWFTARLEDRKERDLGFGLAMICMVLLSPVAWEHYMVLIILPLTLVWVELPRAGALVHKAVFLAVVTLFWARSRGIHWLAGIEGHLVEPWQVILFLSTQFYALIGLYGLGIEALIRHRRSRQDHDQALAADRVPEPRAGAVEDRGSVATSRIPGA